MFLVIVFSLSFGSSVYATEVGEHKVYLEINDVGRDSPVFCRVDISYKDLTSNDIYYLVFNDIYGFEGRDDYGVLDCEVNGAVFGSEIICKPNTENKTDYNVTLSYYLSKIQSQVSEVYLMNYIYSFSDPTEHFSVDVILPEGMGLVKKSERFNPIHPIDASVRTDGRRIKVEWDVPKPALGSTKSFTVSYEDMGSIEFLFSTQMYLIASSGIVMLFLVIVLVYLKRSRDRKPGNALALLKGSEKSVLDIILNSGGECIQRQIVRDTGYSKAKVSRIIYDLSVRGIVEKIQKGRTNIIIIKDETLKKKK